MKNMKEGWVVKKLGEVATFINGDRGKNYPSQNDFVKEGIPFINAGHLVDGSVDFSSMNYISEEKYEKLGSGKIWNGDLLFCLRGSLGKKAIVENLDKAAIASSLVIIRCIDIFNRYLYYYLDSPIVEDLIFQSNNGSSQPNLSAKSVASFPIPIPPLSVQSSIVSELDCINDIIEMKREQIKELDALAQSIFYDMFGDPIQNEKGWEVKKLGEVCTDIVDGDHMPPPKSETGIPFITISNIDKDSRTINFSNTFYTTQEYFDSIKPNKIARKGDILYTVTGSYGIPILLNENIEFCFQRHIGLLKPKSIINSIYLCYWALMPQTKAQADFIATGIAQKTVSLKGLRNFTIPLPPLPLQQAFAEKIEAIEKQKELVKRSIAETETLLASRMQHYFEA